MELYVVIEEKIDSKALYDELKDFQINVTDMMNQTFVYGEHLQPAQYATIIEICKKYGKVDM